MKSEDYFEESLATTPKPTATSTITKKPHTGNQIPARKPLEFNSATLDESAASLGILNPIEMNVTAYSESGNGEDVMNRLQTQRNLAKSLLNKASKTVGLPSKYFQQNSVLQESSRNYVKDFSTVNESDLIRKDSVNSQSFYPGNVSTPRTSEHVEKSDKKEVSMFDNITAMSEQLRHSDINIQDICSQLQYRASLCKSLMGQQVSGLESQVFTPAELMSEQLKRDEVSWRKQRDIPAERNSTSSFSTVTGKHSIGNFFETRGKNDLGDLFRSKSPERSHSPTPLIDSTRISNIYPSDSYKVDNKTFKKPGPIDDSSVLSLTKIQKMLADVDVDSPGKMVDKLLKKSDQRRPKSKSPNAPSKEYDCDEYLAQNLSRNSLAVQTHSTVPVHHVSRRSPQHLQVSTVRGKSKSPSHDAICFSSTPFSQSSSIQMEHSSRNTERTLHVSNAHRKSTSPCDDPRCSTSHIPTITVDSHNSRDSGVRTMESEANSNLRYSSKVSTASSIKGSKENVNGGCGSSMGSRCPSSLDSIPEGKLPIKGNKVEIVWGCIKVGRSQSQSFQIQNQLNQKVRIEVSVGGSNFQLIKEGNISEMLTTMVFTLHAFETKTLSVIFRPTRIGAISDKLVFYPCSNSDVIKSLKQTIKLFGYGGHISVDLTKMFKDSNGNFWFSMGALDHKPIIQNFSIKNTGVLSAFAIIELENNGLMSKSVNVKINPIEMVLKPQQEIKVTLMYTPKKEDFKSQNEIIDVGSFKLVSGAEVVRARIRRLCSMLPQKNENIDKTIKRLSKQLPGEDIPSDLGLLNEGTSSIADLLKCITAKQIRLNIEKNPNVTLEISNSFFNDSTMFKTLYQDSTTIQDENDFNKPNKLFTVDPNRIVFSLPSKKSDTIFIQSKSKTPEKFKVTVTEGFKVSPSNGVVSSDEFVVITVTCTKMRNDVGKLQVYIKNETADVDLKAIVLRN
nr:uncharacterized protein LOC111418218 [Onthophagus taurus]